MSKLKLDGFLGIPFGTALEETKSRILEKPGAVFLENSSNEQTLFFEGLKFAGRNIDMLLITFFDKQFCKATVYIKPSLESRILELYTEIKNEVNSKYYITSEDYETYDFPYEKNDGYLESAISLGKASICSFWTFENTDDENDMLALTINESIEISIAYEKGNLMTKLVEKIKRSNSEDY